MKLKNLYSDASRKAAVKKMKLAISKFTLNSESIEVVRQQINKMSNNTNHKQYV